ncbi:possible virion structural protein [Campylobacter phage CP220]|uniref:Possible virion structural protein n=1 Tax=Campylobacter phage CP220 TaxID=2994044 RepID=D5GV19_9CAUD|nr:virion structural protein [Campylobacter phage CP220]CBJ93836.1 possible virion structural protein [Campylobacter phage CP220]
MTELRLNVDSKDTIEAGDYKSTQRGMLTFSKNAVYLGDGNKANKIIDAESLKTEIEKVQNNVNNTITQQIQNVNNTITQVQNAPAVQFLNICDNATDLATLKSSVTLKNVFDNWVRHSIMNSASGPKLDDDAGQAEAAKWSYIEAEDAIASNINSSYYNMFLSNDVKDTYSVQISAVGQDGDDDVLSIVVAAKMINGKLYTLSALRSLQLNALPGGTSWGLFFNYCGNNEEPYTTYRLLASKGDITNNYPKTTWRAGRHLLKVTRTKNRVQCWTSDLNKALDNNSLIDYTLPTTKPSVLSNNEFNVLKELLNSPCQMGFGNWSQNIKFYFDSQSGVYDDTIIDISKNQKWTYNSSNKTWVASALDNSIIPENVLISSKKTKKLFYNNGIEISSLN